MEEWVSGSSESDSRNQVFALRHSTGSSWLLSINTSPHAFVYTFRERYGHLDRYRHKLRLGTLDTLHRVSRLMTVLYPATCDCSLIDRVEQTACTDAGLCERLSCRKRQERAVKERVIDIVQKKITGSFLRISSREIWKFTNQTLPVVITS